VLFTAVTLGHVTGIVFGCLEAIASILSSRAWKAALN